MPLTTRPSLTSRHGMIRLASIRQCLLELNDTLVEGFADDDTVQTPVINLSKTLHIRNRRNATGSDDRQFGVVEHFPYCLDVRTLQNAVTRNIRVNQQTRADPLESFGERNRRDVRVFRPTGYLDVPIKGVAC